MNEVRARNVEGFGCEDEQGLFILASKTNMQRIKIAPAILAIERREKEPVWARGARDSYLYLYQLYWSLHPRLSSPSNHCHHHYLFSRLLIKQVVEHEDLPGWGWGWECDGVEILYRMRGEREERRSRWSWLHTCLNPRHRLTYSVRFM